ncbi:hypothetical protein GCM10007049_39390 [Echinicola pacifica]|uniref:YCII-related domain-containing protein n=1 Tax=Echinicola pacifica TaxID=346377 RepID=A0A918UYK0_9BACT|nr:YciI-like protein [Echinicola pacifica]GGZ42430.1 hypothetical protein GCM10007049_39390 [Echinicola pacifica]
MTYYILSYQTAPDYMLRREAFRAAHLDHVKHYQAQGLLLMAGALMDPADKAVLIFKAEDSTIPEDFAKNDPYVLHSVVSSWEVRAWNVVVGGEY